MKFRLLLATLIVILLPSIAWAADDGNNGTIKLCAEGACTDFPPQNVPHLPCLFSLEFRGYEDGEDLEGDIIIEAHPPTGDGRVLFEQTVFIGEDPAGGAPDLDAQVPIDLTSALQAMLDDGFTPHPKQGWHIKITVHADDSQGADTKHKVVWVQDCVSPSPTPTTPPPTTTTPPPTTTTPPPTTTTTTPPPTTHTPPPSTTTHTNPPPTTRTTSTRTTVTPSPSDTAFTGGNATLPMFVGATLLLLGLGALGLARKFSN